MYDLDEASGAGTFLDVPVPSRTNVGECVFALYYRQQSYPKKTDSTAIDHLRFSMAAMTFLNRMKPEVPGCETRLFSFATEHEFADAWRRIHRWVGNRKIAIGAMLMHSNQNQGIHSHPTVQEHGHDGTISPGELAALSRLRWLDTGLLARRPGDTGRWSRLRPRVCGTDGSGLETRDNPQTTPKRDDFRRR